MGIGRKETYQMGDHPDVRDKTITDAEYERRADLARRSDEVDKRADPEGFERRAALARKQKEARDGAADRERKQGMIKIQELLVSLMQNEGLQGNYLERISDPNTTVGQLKAILSRLLEGTQQGYNEAQDRYQHGVEDSEEPPADNEEYAEYLKSKVDRAKKVQEVAGSQMSNFEKQRKRFEPLSRLLTSYALDDGDTLTDYRQRLDTHIEEMNFRDAEKKEAA